MISNATTLIRRSRTRAATFALLLALISGLLLFLPLNELDAGAGRLSVFAKVIGAVGLVFLLVTLPRVFRSRVELRLDQKGLTYFPWSDQCVPWSSIDNISLKKMNRFEVICISLKDPSAFNIKRGAALRSRLNGGTVGYGDLTILPYMIDHSSDQIVDEIQSKSGRQIV